MLFLGAVATYEVRNPICDFSDGTCSIHQSQRLSNLKTSFDNLMKSLQRPNSLKAFNFKTRILEDLTWKIEDEHRRLLLNANPIHLVINNSYRE